MFKQICSHCGQDFTISPVLLLLLFAIIEQTNFRLLVFSMQIEKTLSNDGLYLCENKQNTSSPHY